MLLLIISPVRLGVCYCQLMNPQVVNTLHVPPLYQKLHLPPFLNLQTTRAKVDTEYAFHFDAELFEGLAMPPKPRPIIATATFFQTSLQQISPILDT